ncbi:MAG TPA: T9SS type A sorting domain-containing protein, partial [Bacteroidia bacterium]|nr:T9SS type A sorting domain-containing protein [Bacteroidia bacterium]
NDTAFFIQVIDTLDAALDPATLILTGSSHPMTFEQSPDGILRFRFDNVLLPDSGTNMEASNGFIRFRIKPYPALPNYTVVRNTAHIFFDFNDGVMTNTVFNTFLDSILISVPELNTNVPLSIYPNPATRSVNVLYPNPGNSSCTFQLVDRLGRTIQQGIDSSGSIVLETNHLIPGIYFVLIHNQDNSIRFSGRVAVQ